MMIASISDSASQRDPFLFLLLAFFSTYTQSNVIPFKQFNYYTVHNLNTRILTLLGEDGLLHPYKNFYD